MTVYVDDMYLYPMGALGRMKMSHMVADTTQELVAMAALIGVQPKWIQRAGTAREHFDIAQSKREIALANGAVAVTLRQCSAMCARRRVEGALGRPEEAQAWHSLYLAQCEVTE
ncbi:DUF4031 domain-containing protein [Paraburkholderia strydomiana]|uniref:DUF4031 domain-containing protein n=1 Tax=Paraburkholderia strydomiana TaxID=1245417 RepID=UPI0038BC11D8